MSFQLAYLSPQSRDGGETTQLGLAIGDELLGDVGVVLPHEMAPWVMSDE
jgi:hypothetical protein